MSVSVIEALAGAYDKRLRADDKRFRNSVVVIDQEGSFFHFKSAFILDYGEYIMTFSEHQGYRVFCKEELTGYWQYKEVKIEEYK